MIEKTILDYLKGKLSVPVFMEVPEIAPKSFVIIERLGSSRADMFGSATFAVQSYAKTLYQTAELNEAVKQEMLSIVELDSISSCKLDRDYNFTDTQTKRYRYQAIFEIAHY